MIDRRHSPVYRQLEAYDEVWKRDHAAAMACRDWEDALAIGVNMFHMLREREESWREQVFRGTRDYAEDDNRDHLARFAAWQDTTAEVLTTILPQLEAQFGKIEAADELRRCADEVARILREWQPPRLSMAVGLREMTLSPEAAAEFKRILEEAKTNPPPMPAGPIPQEISAEEFLARLARRRS